MTSAESKQLVAQVIDELPPEKVAQLVEYAKTLREGEGRGKGKPRVLGAFEGQIKILPGFYEALPDDLLDEFEGEDEVNLLLDTCVFLWASGDRARLSDRARDLLVDPENTLLLSTVSVWEISAKFARGTLILPIEPSVLVLRAREQLGAESLQLNEPSALLASTLPPLHRDPFDRMLVCQALHHGLTLVTPDPQIQQYAVPVIW